MRIGLVASTGALPVVPGQAFVLTAHLAASPTLGGAPTGNVVFKDGGNILGAGRLNRNGSASLSVSLATAGRHSLTASYAGDNDHNSATATPITETVAKAATSVVLTSPLNEIRFGESVTFTAVVMRSAPARLIPTGQVAFIDGTKLLGKVTVQGGRATWTANAMLAVGVHRISGHYLGEFKRFNQWLADLDAHSGLTFGSRLRRGRCGCGS